MSRRLPWVLCLAVACTSGTETGNPFRAELSTTAHSTDPAIATVGDGASISVDSAWISLGDVTFWAAGVCDDPAHQEVALVGPSVVDLVPAVSYEEFDPMRDLYCRVEVPMQIATAAPAEAPVELEGNALVVTGTRADGDPFVVVSHATPLLDIRGPMDELVLDETRSTLLVAFDVAAWFAGVDLAAIAPDGAGVVRLDETTHPSVLATFESNVAHSADLHHDANGNGHVEPGEERVAIHH